MQSRRDFPRSDIVVTGVDALTLEAQQGRFWGLAAVRQRETRFLTDGKY